MEVWKKSRRLGQAKGAVPGALSLATAILSWIPDSFYPFLSLFLRGWLLYLWPCFSKCWIQFQTCFVGISHGGAASTATKAMCPKEDPWSPISCPPRTPQVNDTMISVVTQAHNLPIPSPKPTAESKRIFEFSLQYVFWLFVPSVTIFVRALVLPTWTLSPYQPRRTFPKCNPSGIHSLCSRSFYFQWLLGKLNRNEI